MSDAIWNRTVLALLTTLLAAGCGGNDEGNSGGGGTVSEQWQGYCTVVFSSDHAVIDSFGDALFTARAGQEFLVKSYSETTRANLFYLTNSGPWDFEVMPAGVPPLYPFSSTCDLNNAVSHYGVFADVSVFADETLTTKLCDLTRGTTLPSAGMSVGYSLAGEISFSGPATYQVELGPFAAQCGAASGYVSVPETQVFGTTTWLVPFDTLLSPD